MKLSYLLTAICFFLFSQTANAEEAIIISQEGSPLRIDTYSAAYSAGVGRYSREGIVHAVQMTNTSEQAVLAYKVSFVAFDAFNEDMGRALGGIAITTVGIGATAKGSWRHNPYASFTFEGYGTGVAYVSTVRMSDGSIWTADQNYILAQLQKIKQDLTADIFENAEE